jgi:hypothetical protein
MVRRRSVSAIRRGLGGCEAAIDRVGRSGGIARVVGQQERNHAGHVLGRPMATQRDGLGERLTGPGEHFVSQLEGHPAGDRSGSTGVDPDAASALFERGGLGHADNGVL